MSENRQKGTGMEKLFEICRLAQISTKDFRQNTVFVCRGDLRSPAGVRSTPLQVVWWVRCKRGMRIATPSVRTGLLRAKSLASSVALCTPACGRASQ